METSSARPYFAIFAIIAIAVAAFILKNEYAGAAQTPETVSTPSNSADRQLVKSEHGVDMVPEPIPQWFKRVGYEKLGFDNQGDMEKAEAMMTGGGITDPTPDQLALIHKMHSSTNPVTERMGFNLMVKVQGTKGRKEFVQEVTSMYSPKGPNQEFLKIALQWMKTGDRDLVDQMVKDSKQPTMGPFLEDTQWGRENPGK